MKRTISIVLCLLLMLSVFALPLTVNASTAEEAEFDPVMTMWYSVEYERTPESLSCWDDAYVYTWVPESDGVLTLAADEECSDIWVSISNVDNVADAGATLEYYPADGIDSGEVDYNVTAGTNYEISVMTWSESSGSVWFFAYFEAGSADGFVGSGTADDPFVIEDGISSLPGLGYGESVYYIINDLDVALVYDLTVNGSYMNDYFDVLVENNQVTASSMLGSATVEDIVPFVASKALVFKITNTTLGEGGPYTFSLAETEILDTLGTEEDPDTLVLDTPTTANIASVCYYYSYEATEDGVLSVNITDTTDWICAISGGEAEAQYCTSDDDVVVNPVKYDVKAGETITLWVAKTNFGAGTVSFTATLEEPGTSGPSVSEFEIGDVNRDGTINIKDATLIQKAIAKIAVLDEEQEILGDYDYNETVNIKDATAIQKKLAGLL